MARKAATNAIGSIYFIYSAQAGAVKIGFSTNVPERFSTLQIASPSKLVLLGTMMGSMEDEQRLHTKFQRVHGEWFCLTAPLLSFMQQRVTLVSPLPSLPQPPTRQAVAPPAPVAPAPPPAQRMVPSFWANLHTIAHLELWTALILSAYFSCSLVLLPALLEIPRSLVAPPLFTLLYVLVCVWCLTYRYRGQRVPYGRPFLSVLIMVIGDKIACWQEQRASLKVEV